MIDIAEMAAALARRIEATRGWANRELAEWIVRKDLEALRALTGGIV